MLGDMPLMDQNSDIELVLQKYREDPPMFGGWPKSIWHRRPAGDQVIHLAAFFGDQKDLEMLLENGADINSKGEGGHTPLFNAIIAEEYEAARLLLRHGADPEITNDFGMKPSGSASWNQIQG